jgi:hypothetical protein
VRQPIPGPMANLEAAEFEAKIRNQNFIHKSRIYPKYLILYRLKAIFL